MLTYPKWLEQNHRRARRREIARTALSIAVYVGGLLALGWVIGGVGAVVAIWRGR